MTKKINYFLIYSTGSVGTTWLALCMNHHPSAGISVLGEVPKPSQLDFPGRGLNKAQHLHREIVRFFEDRAYYGDAAAGIVKTFREDTVKWVKAQGGQIAQLTRNPLAAKIGPTFRKSRVAHTDQLRKFFEKRHGRRPKTEEEWTEGYIMRTAAVHHKLLDRGYPIVRLEDLNLSLAAGGNFFRKFMEWLTQVPWPQDYIAGIQRNFRPNRPLMNTLKWSKLDKKIGRKRVESSRVEINREIGPGLERTSSWHVDPTALICWHELSDEQLHQYNENMESWDKILGYNQSYPGAVEVKWRFRNKYGWGEPVRRRVWQTS